MLEVLTPEPLPLADRRRDRAVRRAVQDLRAGAPVVLHAPRPLLLLAAETATEPALTEFLALAAGQTALLRADGASSGTPGLAQLRLPAEFSAARLRALAETPLARSAMKRLPVPPHAESVLRLARLALLLPAVLMADIESDAPELLSVSPADIASYQPQHSALARVVEAAVPLKDAKSCRVVAFRPEDGAIEHLAVLIGRPEQQATPLVRLHSECFTGDLLGSLRCDCGPQLHGALRRMAADGAGVLLYMAQEGRGIGLVNKLRAYALQDAGLDTMEANLALGFAADERSFAPAAAMLRALGIGRIRLLTNNPQKLAGLAACGIEIAGRVSHAFAANGVNDAYLATKAKRFGHML